MFWYLLVTAALACTSAAPTSEMPVMYVDPRAIAMCAMNVIYWCDNTKIPQESMVETIISNNPHMQYEGGFSRALCTINPHMAGVNCTKNGEPWFSCSDNEVFYKGKKLDPQDTSFAVRLCKTTSEWAFNEIMVQNLSYTNETISKGLEN